MLTTKLDNICYLENCYLDYNCSLALDSKDGDNSDRDNLKFFQVTFLTVYLGYFSSLDTT